MSELFFTSSACDILLTGRLSAVWEIRVWVSKKKDKGKTEWQLNRMGYSSSSNRTVAAYSKQTLRNTLLRHERVNSSH